MALVLAGVPFLVLRVPVPLPVLLLGLVTFCVAFAVPGWALFRSQTSLSPDEPFALRTTAWCQAPKGSPVRIFAANPGGRLIVWALLLSAALTAVADLIFYAGGHKGQPVRVGEIVFDFVPLVLAIALVLWRPRPWAFLVAGLLLALQPTLDLFVFNTPESILRANSPSDTFIYILVAAALALAVIFGWLGFARADRTRAM